MAASDLAALRASAIRLAGARHDYDGLIDRIGDARLVLLGEATHGTHEFYRVRAEITKRLITERGFLAVAIEGDWPGSFRVHRYVTGGKARDREAAHALRGFRRFPTWMWRNADVLDFVRWLRAWNDTRARDERVGFFGLDLYSLYASIEAVLAYLEDADPKAARRARDRYACFDCFSSDAERYALTAGLDLEASCERDVTAQLVEMQARSRRALATNGSREDAEEIFNAEQNARVVMSAEQYYRHTCGGRVSTWNLRDQHMVATLDALSEWIERRAGRAKIVVWAHNSHLGDARATEMAAAGEHNVGQLVRERYGADAFLVGFTTFDGTVTASRDWDSPAERRYVRPALAESWESLFHAVDRSPFMLLTADGDAAPALRARRLGRAIGVVYVPEAERTSHYFQSRIGQQFDAILHFDRTRAVEPLERTLGWEAGEARDQDPTIPFAV
jgi:erythromycin esterase-like protein